MSTKTIGFTNLSGFFPKSVIISTVLPFLDALNTRRGHVVVVETFIWANSLNLQTFSQLISQVVFTHWSSVHYSVVCICSGTCICTNIIRSHRPVCVSHRMDEISEYTKTLCERNYISSIRILLSVCPSFLSFIVFV